MHVLRTIITVIIRVPADDAFVNNPVESINDFLPFVYCECMRRGNIIQYIKCGVLSPDQWNKKPYYGEPYVEDDIVDGYMIDDARIQDLVKHLASAEREFERWNKNGSEPQPDIDLDELSREASRIVGRGLKLIEDSEQGVLRFIITGRQYQRIW